jgi:hypothetical protein
VTDVVRQVSAQDHAAEAEHPMRGLRDGWRRLERTLPSNTEPVRTRLEISLSPEETEWLDRAAGRAQLTAAAFVKALLAKARATDQR